MTVAPGTGLPAESVTNTISGEANVPPTGAWLMSGALPPWTYVMLAAAPTLVSVNAALLATPTTDALTV